MNNFLLSKISALFLAAVVLNSLVAPAWSMEGEDEKDQNSHSIITRKTSNNADENENNNEKNNTSDKDYFSPLPLEIKAHILEMAAFDLGEDKKDLGTLALVCKDWYYNIMHNDREGDTIKLSIWRAWIYGRCGRNDIIDSEEQEIFSRFYKGVLIYRPIKNSDEGMIRFLISDFENPLAGTFDLSSCGNTGKYLSINTGYRKVQTPANAKKIEIWFTPWFLADKEKSELPEGHHIRAISKNWDPAMAPIGIFWTWGGWDAENHIRYCDHSTRQSMEKISSQNLYTTFTNSGPSALHPTRAERWEFTGVGQDFTLRF